MEFKALLQERFSCRQYADRPVEPEKLEAVLEAGRLAPTAKNLQEQRIYVLRSPEALARVDSRTPCRYGAPLVLCVAFDKESVYHYPGEKYTSGGEDAAIVATHMMLAATDEGLASCWLNFFDPDLLKADLGLPENEEILMLLDLGYAAPGAEPRDTHFQRRPLSETVKEL